MLNANAFIFKISRGVMLENESLNLIFLKITSRIYRDKFMKGSVKYLFNKICASWRIKMVVYK